MRIVLLACLLAVATRAATATAPPIVLVVAFDGMRLDRLGCGGARRNVAPTLDLLCAGGTTFTHAYAQSAWAPASLASLLTSTRPSEHGVNAGDDVLDTGRPTLAGVVATAGWATAAWSSDPADARRGLLRGFADVADVVTSADAPLAFEPAERTALPVLGWLGDHHRELEHRGALLFLHLEPGRLGLLPPPEYLRRFVAHEDIPRATALAARAAAFQLRFSFEETGLLADVADAGVALADGSLSRILDELRAPELAERLWVVVLAPYAEALIEHGIVGHGTTLYDEAIHVPLVFAPPAGRRGGARPDAVVQLIDVAPTILDLAGLPPAPAFRGRSLRAGVEGRPLAGAEAVAELVAPNPLRAHVRATVAPDLRKRIERADGASETYDLRHDPSEQHDLGG